MKRVLLCILAVLVLAVAGGAFYVTHMDTDFLVRRIAEVTQKATGAPLELASAPRISLLPPGISFGGARWNGAAGGNAVDISLAGGMARLELAPLFSGRIVLGEIRLDKPEARIRLAAPASGDAAGAPGEAPATTAKEHKAPDDALPFELGRLTVSQGALRLEDSRRDIRVSGFNLSLDNLRRREDIPLQGDLVLDIGERRGAAGASPEAAKPVTLLKGNLAFKGTLRYYAPNLTFRQVSVAFTPLQGVIPRELAPLQLTGEGALDLATLRLSLPAARLTTPQGRLRLSGEGGLEPLAFAGDITLTGSAHKLAALAGVALPEAAADSVELSSRVDLAGTRLGLDARLELGGAQQGRDSWFARNEAPEAAPEARLTLKGQGTLQPFAFGGDVTLSGSAAALAALGGATPPRDMPDAVALRSRVDLAGTRLGLDARLALSAAPEGKPEAELTLKGNGSLEPAAFAGDVALTGSARRLAALAGATLPGDAPDTLDAQSRLDFADFFVRLAPLSVRAAGLTLDGTLGIRLPRAAETDPTYDAALRMGPVVLDPWIAALKGGAGHGGAAPAGEGPEGGNAEAPAKPGGKGPAPALPSLDLRLTIDQVRYGAYALNQVSTHIVSAGSEVDVAPLKATLATGGELKVSGRADLATSSCVGSASAIDLNIGELCRTAGKPGLAVGTVSLVMPRLEAAGADSAALLASLNGNGVLMGRDLSTPALRDVGAKLRALPVKVRIPDRLETLEAPFTISRGELTAPSITGGSLGIFLTGRLQASLVRQYLEGTALLTGLPVPVPLSFKGPFNDIAVSLDPKLGLGLGAGALPGVVPGALGLPAGGTGSGNPVPDRARQAADMVRGLLGR